MDGFGLGDFGDGHSQIRHSQAMPDHYQMGNEPFGVRQAVPAFTSPGESHVVSTSRMMRPPGVGPGQMGGHGPVGTYGHPNRMMMPPGSHPGLVHPMSAGAGGVMHQRHPQLVGHHQQPPPPHRGLHPPPPPQSRYYGGQNGGGVHPPPPMGPPIGAPPISNSHQHLTPPSGGRMVGPGQPTPNAGPPGAGGGGGGVGGHNMVIPNNHQFRNGDLYSPTAPLPGNRPTMLNHSMSARQPLTRPMTHPTMTDTVQYQSAQAHTNDHNRQNPISSVKPNGQRILSTPHDNAGTTSEEPSYESNDEEEYIETENDQPTVERLDNSTMIKELKVGKKRRKELLEYDDRQRMLRLVDAFSDEQVNRYEMYRRSCFPRNQIKRLMTQTANCSVHQQVCIAMAGVAKVFVGEIVEEALRVADGKTHEGPLLPSHIREAVRRLGQVDGSHLNDVGKKNKRLF